MKKSFLALCLSVTVLTTACGTGNHQPIELPSTSTDAPSETTKGIKPSQSVKKETALQWEGNREASFLTTVTNYDLGDRSYQAQSGKTMPYKLRGVLALPEGEGPYPLVLITHGSHANEDDSQRFDIGFSYLAEALASHGYVAVSMDMSAPYLWKYGDGDDKEKSVAVADAQIQALKQAEGYDTALQGKINWDQVHLIGHSRGGEAIFDIATAQIEAGQPITSLLAVAPTRPADLEEMVLPDITTGIVVPEYDGDVVSLDGFSIQEVLADKGQAFSSVTLLHQANHNGFNSQLTANDALLARSQEQLADQLTQEKQREFLAAYAVDFLSGSLTVPGQTQPNQMYGMDVSTRFYAPTDQNLLASVVPDQFQIQDMTVTPLVDSWFFELDQVAVDTVTFGQSQYQTRSLLDIQWKSNNGKLTFVPDQTDFSGHGLLTFRVLTDPGDDHNQDMGYQSFSVTITDTQGNQSTVILADQRNSLKKPSGFLDSTPLFDKELQFWSSPTPMADTSIPLSLFENLDLSSIGEITISTDQTARGGLYLEQILLQ